MTGQLAVVILAAGRSSRFKSRKSKLLHTLCGKPMFEWVLESVALLNPAQVVVVYGTHSESLAREYSNGFRGMPLTFVLQDPPNGTGHAMMQVEPALLPEISRLIVLPGDAPLIMSSELLKLIRASDEYPGFHALLTAHVDDPSGYGRILPSHDDPQVISRIVEENDASISEKSIRNVNSGMYLFTRDVFDQLRKSAEQFGDRNAKGEYYLPDVVRIAPTLAVEAGGAWTITGVNDRVVLSHCEAILQQSLRLRFMENGVTFILPESTYLHYDVQIGEDVEIGPHCVLTSGTRIGRGTRLVQGCHLDACVIGEDCVISHVHATEAIVGNQVRVGPYVNLRPGTELGDEVKVGNFVETKKAKVGRGSKLPHLQYVGDATIGENVNIGAGTIFCNYDGINKHQTVIGDNVFIGSNSSLQAPLVIGEGAFVAMASAVTKDVPPGALAVGRARQENKEGYADELRERQKRKKQAAEQNGSHGAAPGDNSPSGSEPGSEGNTGSQADDSEGTGSEANGGTGL